MCFIQSSFTFATHYNWNGDTIVFDSTIKAMRSLPDVKQSRRYYVDIREFIGSQNNAVMHRTLSAIAHSISQDQRYKFFIKEQGAFDFRAFKVLEYVCENIRYTRTTSRDYDTWLFPDETLALKRGDCEDMSFLIASLLIASGISPYTVRVAMGYIYDQTTSALHQHTWVMYRAEDGRWMLFDPLATSTNWKKSSPKNIHLTHATRATSVQGEADDTQLHRHSRFEYIPLYVCNSDHLWQVESPFQKHSPFADFVDTHFKAGKRFWNAFNPKFGATTHANIFLKALRDSGLFSDAEVFIINSASLAIDVDLLGYHPFDHFDDGYIAEGWRRVHERLQTGSLIDFAHALHGVADFYAHSSYGHFFMHEDHIPIWSGALSIKNRAKTLADTYVHAPLRAHAGSLNLDNFSSNTSNAPAERPPAATAHWCSQHIISGRYAQPGDSQEGAGTPGALTRYPYELRTAEQLSMRGWLPHHNEIAVDSDTMSAAHLLYNQADYTTQYRLRKDAAIRHSLALAQEWKKKNG